MAITTVNSHGMIKQSPFRFGIMCEFRATPVRDFTTAEFRRDMKLTESSMRNVVQENTVLISQTDSSFSSDVRKNNMAHNKPDILTN
jgi:hypothetical protein